MTDQDAVVNHYKERSLTLLSDLLEDMQEFRDMTFTRREAMTSDSFERVREAAMGALLALANLTDAVRAVARQEVGHG